MRPVTPYRGVGGVVQDPRPAGIPAGVHTSVPMNRLPTVWLVVLLLAGCARTHSVAPSVQSIDAETALRYGLVTKVVEPEALMSAAKEMASTIASRGPAAVALIKACVNRGVNADIEVGGSYESEAFATCFALGEAQEGINAFLGKRKPGWSRSKE